MSAPAAPTGVVARAHPFTPLVVSLAVIFLAFLLPAPTGPIALAGVLALSTVPLGDPRALIPVAWLAVPFWVLLFLLHALLGGGETFALGPLTLSVHGSAVALAQGARLTAIIIASVLVIRGFRPGRFVDAALEAGWPWSAAYLTAATLNAIHRFQERALRVQEAMRSRGLRVRGGIVTRARAFVPLALPLMLGALHEVDERTFALATRQVRVEKARRTPLHPPEDTGADRVVRWGAALSLAGALAWRVLG